MDGITLTRFLSVIKNKPANIPWNDGHEIEFEIGLAGIPNKDQPALLKAVVMAGGKFRPEVSEVRELWRKLSSPVGAMTSTKALGRVLELMRTYGEAGARHADYPDAWPGIRDLGAPPHMENAPKAVQETIAAFGGWVAMCREDIEASHFRAQFERLYKASVAGEGDAEINRIRLEYQASRQSALPDGTECPALRMETYREPNRTEASEIMGRFGEIIAKRSAA